MVTATAIMSITSITSVGVATAVAMAVNFAIGFAASYLLAKNMGDGGAPSASDYKQTIQRDKAAQRVLYGERQIGMVMNYAEEQDGKQNIGDKSGQSYEKLYLSGMICNHPVESYSDVYLDDKPIGDYGDRVEIHHVNGTSVIPSFLLNEATQYDTDMTGDNAYWIALKLTHDRELFSGIPSPLITVKGKRVKDVRTGAIVYSNNAALVIYDFYVNYMRVPEERLMLSGTGSFIDAANLCDELMSTGERRYTINGMFELNSKPSDILNEMLKSCGGTLIRTSGMIGLLPAAYYGAPSFTITESDIVGEVTMSPQESMGDAVNVMQGSYVEPTDTWSDQDFEDVRNEAAIERDGYEITEDVTYNYVTNAAQARRLAYLELGRRTIGGATELTMSPKGAYCRVGRVVQLDLPQLGLSGEFRVIGQTENSDLSFKVSLQREDIAIYDDSVGKPYSPPPILDTGGQTVPTPIGLQFTVDYNNVVGNTIQGKLVWQRASASAAKYIVQVVNSDTDEVAQAGETQSFTFDVTALPQGNYEGRVRAVDSRGRTSAPASTTWSVGKPDAPSIDITEVNNSNWSIEIIPNIVGGVPQGTEFEFNYLADNDSYITGAPSYDQSNIGLSKKITTASSLNHAGLTPDRWQHYWVRSISPYGVSDYIYIRTGTTKDDSLVVTVVEKLKAIEVESQNWTPDSDGRSAQGYKLFSNATARYVMADGTVLTNTDGSIDGLFVANNAEIRGHMIAESLSFVGGAAEGVVDQLGMYPDQNSLQIQGNYQQGVKGWAIDSSGNVEFNNGVFRGTLDGADGNFSGTVRADKIIGDLVSAKAYPASTGGMYGDEYKTITSRMTVTNNTGDSATVVLQLPLCELSSNDTDRGGNIQLTVQKSSNSSFSGASTIFARWYNIGQPDTGTGVMPISVVVTDELDYSSNEPNWYYRVIAYSTTGNARVVGDKTIGQLFRNGGSWK